MLVLRFAVKAPRSNVPLFTKIFPILALDETREGKFAVSVLVPVPLMIKVE